MVLNCYVTVLSIFQIKMYVNEKNAFLLKRFSVLQLFNRTILDLEIVKGYRSFYISAIFIGMLRNS